MNSKRNTVGFLLALVACADSPPTIASDGEDGGQIDMGQLDVGGPDVGSETEGIPTAPEGSYHLIASWLTLMGDSGAFDSAFVANFEFADDRVVVRHRPCDETSFSETAYRLETVSDGVALLLPQSGEAPTFLGGPPLDELRLEFAGPCEVELTVTNGPVSWTVRPQPGEVCILDWCDDLEPGSDRIRVEYCPGEPQLECDES